MRIWESEQIMKVYTIRGPRTSRSFRGSLNTIVPSRSTPCPLLRKMCDLRGIVVELCTGRFVSHASSLAGRAAERAPSSKSAQSRREEEKKCAERLNVIFARRRIDRSGSMRPARRQTITVCTLATTPPPTSWMRERGKKGRRRCQDENETGNLGN